MQSVCIRSVAGLSLSYSDSGRRQGAGAGEREEGQERGRVPKRGRKEGPKKNGATSIRTVREAELGRLLARLLHDRARVGCWRVVFGCVVVVVCRVWMCSSDGVLCLDVYV